MSKIELGELTRKSLEIFGINNISELEDVLINENISDGSILVYDKDISKWVNKSIIDAIGIMEPASQDSIGSIGLVPAPGLG